jgi:hypothetical protein
MLPQVVPLIIQEISLIVGSVDHSKVSSETVFDLALIRDR